VQRGILQAVHVHTTNQLVDMLTKPLSRARTELLRSKIGLTDGSPILRGCKRESLQSSASLPFNPKKHKHKPAIRNKR